ncbi:MAG: hypothetical protein LBQ61_09370, partial [Spirochaetales bacterium]|nr:hypothetical protein [Spirochaetales bacterium]
MTAQRRLLRLYARAYAERDIDLLAPHIAPLVEYSRQASPKTWEKNTFLKFLEGRFEDQRRTCRQFYGIMKIVTDDNNISFLYLSAFSQKLLFRISSEGEMITRIDVSPCAGDKFKAEEILWDTTGDGEGKLFDRLNYTDDGFIKIGPAEDPEEIIRLIITTGYARDYCIAETFNETFITRFMAAGFIVLSKYRFVNNRYALWLKFLFPPERSVLYFDDMIIKKPPAARNYQLRFDGDFAPIGRRCCQNPRGIRLSVRVIEALEDIQQTGPWPVRMVSFGLYQRGLLLAGEFGVVSGR